MGTETSKYAGAFPGPYEYRAHKHADWGDINLPGSTTIVAQVNAYLRGIENGEVTHWDFDECRRAGVDPARATGLLMADSWTLLQERDALAAENAALRERLEQANGRVAELERVMQACLPEGLCLSSNDEAHCRKYDTCEECGHASIRAALAQPDADDGEKG